MIYQHTQLHSFVSVHTRVEKLLRRSHAISDRLIAELDASHGRRRMELDCSEGSCNSGGERGCQYGALVVM